jgi:hypothetical protein
MQHMFSRIISLYSCFISKILPSIDFVADFEDFSYDVYVFMCLMESKMTRWSLIVSEQTDQRLRAFLGQKGAKKGGISRFVEEAVERLLRFEEAVSLIQERNLRYPESEIMADIDEAMKATRATPRH